VTVSQSKFFTAVPTSLVLVLVPCVRDFKYFLMSPISMHLRRRISALVAAALCGALLSPLAHAAGMVDLLSLAFEGNPLLQSQARLVEASRAEVRGANWQYFPTPSVSVEQVSADKNDAAYNKDKQVMTFRLQQPLWSAGRLSAGVTRAEAVAAVAQAQMEETRQQLALRTIQTWGEWKTGQQKVQALRDSLQTHKRLYELIQRRVQGGLSAEADEVLAQSRMDQTQAELTIAQAQLTTALARFEQLTGQKLESQQLGIFMVQAVDANEELSDLLERAWQRSPQNAKLQAQVKQYEMEVRIRRAQTLPEVYARAEHQQGSFSANGLSSSNRFFHWPVGLAGGWSVSHLRGRCGPGPLAGRPRGNRLGAPQPHRAGQSGAYFGPHPTAAPAQLDLGIALDSCHGGLLGPPVPGRSQDLGGSHECSARTGPGPHRLGRGGGGLCGGQLAFGRAL
jgi:outer membrane protein TolC